MAHPCVLVAAVLALLLVASPGLLSDLGLAGASDHLVISEVMYDPLLGAVRLDRVVVAKVRHLPP